MVVVTFFLPFSNLLPPPFPYFDFGGFVFLSLGSGHKNDTMLMIFLLHSLIRNFHFDKTDGDSENENLGTCFVFLSLLFPVLFC